jgi:hypothetical protein
MIFYLDFDSKQAEPWFRVHPSLLYLGGIRKPAVHPSMQADLESEGIRTKGAIFILNAPDESCGFMYIPSCSEF